MSKKNTPNPGQNNPSQQPQRINPHTNPNPSKRSESTNSPIPNKASGRPPKK